MAALRPSRTSNGVRYLLLLLSLLGLAACTNATAEDDDSEEGSSAVIGGTKTFERPEVGMLLHGGRCTATLVRPNVVLTAAHCVTGLPKDADVSRDGYSFVVHVSSTERHTYAIDRAHSLPVPADFDGSQRWRDKDIALMRLAEAVPASVATPAVVARAYPRIGSRVVLYGYGCTDRAPGEDGRRPGSGIKRKKESTWSFGRAIGWTETHDLCPGDSGGPLLDAEQRAVFGTNSGTVGDDDRFGEVPRFFADVTSVADRWAAR